MTAEPHVVYRAYDEGDRLLYVGCTKNLRKRLIAHKAARSEWFPYHIRLDVRACGGFVGGRLAEARAIEDELPLFNRYGTAETAAGRADRIREYLRHRLDTG